MSYPPALLRNMSRSWPGKLRADLYREADFVNAIPADLYRAAPLEISRCRLDEPTRGETGDRDG